MNEKPISQKVMQKAFESLDKKLNQKVLLILGGGGAMIWAHQFPLATSDVDAIPKGITIEELDPLIKKIAKELSLPPDWLNAYFSTFSYVILPDYEDHLIPVFSGVHLQVKALSADDMLIMKCFAHRPKDVGHARALLKKGADISKVEKHIETLKKKEIPHAQQALDFLDDLLETAE